MEQKLYLSVLFLFHFQVILGNPISGVTMLDTFTFNKTINAFPYSFIKFDEAYPRGEKHEIWKQLGMEMSEVNEVLIAEVRVKEHGDKINLVWNE